MTPPSGTVTFLFTDIEGSTRRWEADAAAMAAAVARHDALVRRAIEDAGGYVFKTLGDAFCAAFADAAAAVAAAAAAQRAVAAADWSAVGGVRIRAAIHLGDADERDGDYFGPPLNRTARLMSVAHGGQTVVSRAVRDQVEGRLPSGSALRDLGEHRLRDLSRSEHVFQLVVAGLPDAFPPLLSLGRRPNNLPVETASFIGRDAELATLADALPSTRLLTLTGIGGTGKTRLALQLAAAALDDYANGTWFVELAPLAAPELVASAVAGVLGIGELPGQTIETALLDHLADRQALLVLDNCEHVLAAAADLAAAIVRRCGGVRIITTSREPLQVAGERVHPVPPLALPADDDAPDAVAASEVVRLFVERAHAVQPRFALTADNAAAVAAICRRLDGIPLAIELAAARTRLMTPAQILERLDQRFQLLTGGNRTAEPRQQTLRAAIAWSYDLLSPAEQAFLQRLAVFRGGWTIEAAAAVCADVAEDEWMATELLSHLVDKSLVVAGETDGAMRFGLLESVRVFAHEVAATAPAGGAATTPASPPGGADPPDGVRFGLRESVRAYAEAAAAASGALGDAQARHAAYFAARALTLGGLFWGGEQAPALAEFGLEIDNLRAALRHGLADGARQALRICRGIYGYWEVRGLHTEGQRAAEAALAARSDDADPADVGWTMFALALMQQRRGDLAAAERTAAACAATLATVLSAGDLRHVHVLRGNIALAAGDLAAARAHYEQAIATGESPGERSNRSPLVAVHNNLGLVALTLGDVAAARASFDSALRAVAPGSVFAIAVLRFNRALATLAEGDLAATTAELTASLATRREIGDRWGVSLCVEAYGWVAAAGGAPDRAARLLAAAAALRDELGMPLEPLQQRYHDAAAARVAAALDPAARAAAEAEGAALGWEQAVAMAQDGA